MTKSLSEVAQDYGVSTQVILDALREGGFFPVSSDTQQEINDRMLKYLETKIVKKLSTLREAERRLRPSIRKNQLDIDFDILDEENESTFSYRKKQNIESSLLENTSTEEDYFQRSEELTDVNEIINWCKHDKSTFLDLGHLGLKTIPDEVFSFEWLIGLNLGDTYKDIHTELWESSANQGEANNFADGFPEEIGRLKNLKYLYAKNCGINSIENLDALVNLLELDLGNNNIYSLEPLKRMANIAYLGVESNNISNLKPVSNLTRLKFLNASNNKIGNLAPLSSLTALEQLFLDKNEIKDINYLSDLVQLNTLSINFAQLSDIDVISRLSKLEHLFLANNKITEIKVIKDASSLQEIQLDNNPVEDCPMEFWGENDIRQIRGYFDSVARSGGKQIKERSDRNTEIKLILVGNSGVGKTQLANLLVKGKINQPRSTTHGIVVHRWRPDKKSLRAFQGLPKDFLVNIWDFGGQEYYHGTHHLFLSKQAVYVLLWEKSTNHNGVFQTLISENQEADLEHFHYRYWLESIRYYAPHSPIFIVQNKIDDPNQPKERIYNEIFELFGIEQDPYHVSLQNARDGKVEYIRHFERFCTDLCDVLDNQAQSFTFNPNWLKIRDAIQDLSEQKENEFSEAIRGKHFISIDKFNEICKKIDPLLTEDELYTIPNWLEKTGTIIYYEQNTQLKDKIFFSPQWITSGIYEILNQTVLKQNGAFDPTIVSPVIAPYKDTFIALMQEMSILFPHPEKRGWFIAPQYLPAEHPIEDLFRIAEDGLRSSAYRIKIPLFYYRRLMHHLILFFGFEVDVKAKYYWKHGVVFITQSGTRCLIKGLYPEEYEQDGAVLIGIEKKEDSTKIQKEIFMQMLHILSNNLNFMKTPRDPKRKLSAFSITKEDGSKSVFNLQDQAIFRIKTQNEIPSNPTKEQYPFEEGWINEYLEKKKPIPRWLKVLEVSAGNDPFVPYYTLCKYAEEKKVKINFDDGRVILLHNYECFLDQKPKKSVKVFISYASADVQLMQRLDVHLAPLKRLEIIESWNSTDIAPGVDWDAAIRKNLNDANIILLLVTADFIASEYIWKNELSVALEKHNEGKVKVIPILLQPVYYESQTFSKLSVIPVDNNNQVKAVSLWKQQEEGFSVVVKMIKDSIVGI